MILEINKSFRIAIYLVTGLHELGIKTCEHLWTFKISWF